MDGGRAVADVADERGAPVEGGEDRAVLLGHDALQVSERLVVGVGEQIDDLELFNPDRFVDALFDEAG